MNGTSFGRYRLVTLLGRGGMGEVWQAYDTATDRTVALKVLPAHLADDETFKQRFRREARAAAGVNEPHVVPIHNYGEIDGRLYVDMRLIVGSDLDSILTTGPLHPGRAVTIVDQIASALHAAHQIGLVHRDVKPSNILVAAADFAYLIDFGIARSANQTGLTSAGSTIGTWAYMAPERFTAGDADSRVDVYALACVLHQALTGRRPFPGDSVEQQLAAHLGMPPPRPSAFGSVIPRAFDDVIARGMAKNPDDRYATTIEMATAASAAITAPVRRPVPPSPRPLPPQQPQYPRQAPPQTFHHAPTQAAPPANSRRTWPWVAAAAVACVAVIGVVVAISTGVGSAPQADVAAAGSTTSSERSTSTEPSTTTRASSTSATTAASSSTPTPTVVEGWGLGDPTAKAFQPLLPATPSGTAYFGATCYTSTETIFDGGVMVVCGERRTMNDIELDAGNVNGCHFKIETYPAGDDVMQHFFDLAPSMEEATVESWTKGTQTGTLRYGINSTPQLVATFDDPARANSLLYVSCTEQPFDVWWPDAPL